MPLALHDCFTSHEQQLNGINIITLWCCNNKKKLALNAKIILGLLWEVEVLILIDFLLGTCNICVRTNASTPDTSSSIMCV